MEQHKIGCECVICKPAYDQPMDVEHPPMMESSEKKRKSSNTDEQAKRRRLLDSSYFEQPNYETVDNNNLQYYSTEQRSFVPISIGGISPRVTSTITSAMGLSTSTQASTSQQAYCSSSTQDERYDYGLTNEYLQNIAPDSSADEYLPMSSAHYLSHMDPIVEEIVSTSGNIERQSRVLESPIKIRSTGTQVDSELLQDQPTDVPTCVMCNETKNCRIKCHAKGRCIHTASCLHGWQLDRLFELSNDSRYTLAATNSNREFSSSRSESVTTQTHSGEWMGTPSFVRIPEDPATHLNIPMEPALMFIEPGEHSRAPAQVEQEPLEGFEFALDMTQEKYNE